MGLVLKDCRISSSDIRRIIKGSIDGMKDADRLSLITGLDEVVSNIVRHGFVDGRGDLEIRIYQSRYKIRIVVEDNGRPFDPTSLKSRSYNEIIEAEVEGHIGLKVVRKVMDRITYKRLKGRNRLILEKGL